MKLKVNSSGKERRWKVIFGFALILFSTLAYAYCPPQYQENTVAPQFQNAIRALDRAVSTMDKVLSAQLETNTQRLTSAIAVLTKQKAISSNQIAESNRITSQQIATSLNILTQTERVKQARFDYGGEFGQGYSSCKVYATRQVITNREADMGYERRARVMSEVIAAPGRYSDPIQGQRDLIEANKAFCTQDHVDSGLCESLGKIPSASLSVATLFEPAIEGETLYDAKVTFVNNIVGLPDGAVPVSAGMTPATAAYSLMKARKDALISPAITTLKEIQLEYSGVSGTETDMDIPLAVHFQNEIKRYAGNSTEYDAWSRVMTAQNERGVLIELLKIKALDLALQEKQYRQYERMEAQLAALVALEVQSTGLQNQTDGAAQQATKQQVINAIQ